MTDRNLIEKAKEALDHAYAPYSRFPIGAALECGDGTVFTGSKIENAAWRVRCARRSALAAAVIAEHKGFRRIAILRVRSYVSRAAPAAGPVEFSPTYGVLCARADGVMSAIRWQRFCRRRSAALDGQRTYTAHSGNNLSYYCNITPLLETHICYNKMITRIEFVLWEG
jgi:cytidine deaminase